MLARPKLSRKRSNAGTAKSATNSDTASQDDKSNEYESKSYPRKLASEGFYMDPIGNKTPGPREDDLHQIGVWLGERPRKPLEQSPRQPSESRFDETHFRDTCLRINRQLEPRVVRDIGELIFPSPQFPSFPVKQDDPLADLVSELWTKAQRITLKPPKPDVSVGFDPEIAFTDVQRRKFYPYLGPVTYNSQFAATEAVVFPFIACETKKAGGTVDWADNQNAHSMFIAVRSIVCLYTLLGKDTKDLHQKVLAFSVSHSNDEVRIHVYYPITKDVTRIRYHRHEIKKYFFQADNGRERWLAFRFVASVYSDWAPNHLKEICNLLDELPLPAQSTGLSQRLEASSVGTDLDDLQLEPCPDNIAHGSSETLLSTTTAQVKENVAAPQDGPRKVSKQRQRKN